MLMYSTFHEAITDVELNFLAMSQPLKPVFWQGMDISAVPGSEMREQMFVSFGVQVPLTRFSLEDSIGPNMPWAEDHFQERVAGQPVNPGETWLSWPWSNAADKHRTQGDQFSHTYMERYWPKLAGNHGLLRGVRFPYGDLNDVVALLAKDTTTRQAYFPIFFPEDTGAVHGERIPCSIGYHFIIRNGVLHCTYQLRSCDLWRHFRDDLYLTARLMQWVCEELWMQGLRVEPGYLVTHIASLHLFINDFHALTKKLSSRRT